jgi:uncharacterized phage-associated protein
MADLLAPGRATDFLLIESRERGEVLTNLKLQKLLYYAQAWHLALDDIPLFDEDFQAWVHGPVLPTQYFRFRDFRWQPIIAEIGKPDIDDENLAAFLEEIIDVFGSESAVALELMTHRERPWQEARGDLLPYEPSSIPISKTTMRDYYRTLVED